VTTGPCIENSAAARSGIITQGTTRCARKLVITNHDCRPTSTPGGISTCSHWPPDTAGRLRLKLRPQGRSSSPQLHGHQTRARRGFVKAGPGTLCSRAREVSFIVPAALPAWAAQKPVCPSSTLGHDHHDHHDQLRSCRAFASWNSF